MVETYERDPQRIAHDAEENWQITSLITKWSMYMLSACLRITLHLQLHLLLDLL
jgi:hypothetical protein